MSLLDARQVEQDLQTGICVIGGGAAGIALALELHRRGRETLLLESGGFDFDAATQSLYEGQAVGPFQNDPLASRYLSSSRARFYGGSTNAWFGFSWPLEPHEFEPRDWIPLSGWPVSASELSPYYRRAAEVIGVTPFDGAELSREPEERRRELSFEDPGGEFVTRMLYYPNPPTNFGQVYREPIARSSAVTLVLHGNCTELETDEAGRHVESIRVRCLGGTSFRIRAETFVLAAGGVENARLLLASDRVRQGGLGNEQDLVGRYFMEHPHVDVGAYALWCDDARDASLYYSYTENPRLGHWSHGMLCTSEAYQRRTRTLSASFQLGRPQDSEELRLRGLLGGPRRLDELLRGRDGRSRFITGGIHARVEQAPNPQSRVTLSPERDALGVRRGRLDWRLTRLDLDSLYRTTLDLGKNLYRTHQGRIRLDLDPGRLEALRLAYGGHHMGTTRMSDDPKTGVVDADCRVHTVPNLYVAGSSVFPVCGYANPTLTLVALAQRLADHLSQRRAG